MFRLEISVISSFVFMLNGRLTRMTTFMKTKFKISEDKTNIDKYRLAVNITEYHIISKLILQRMPKSSCLRWTYGRPGIDYKVASLF